VHCNPIAEGLPFRALISLAGAVPPPPEAGFFIYVREGGRRGGYSHLRQRKKRMSEMLTVTISPSAHA
jgi:hypothetical protein